MAKLSEIKVDNVVVRIEPALKKKAAKVCADLGLPVSTAIRLFLLEVVRRQELPFQIKATKESRKRGDRNVK